MAPAVVCSSGKIWRGAKFGRCYNGSSWASASEQNQQQKPPHNCVVPCTNHKRDNSTGLLQGRGREWSHDGKFCWAAAKVTSSISCQAPLTPSVRLRSYHEPPQPREHKHTWTSLSVLLKPCVVQERKWKISKRQLKWKQLPTTH